MANQRMNESSNEWVAVEIEMGWLWFEEQRRCGIAKR
jgi:hypothetical protein